MLGRAASVVVQGSQEPAVAERDIECTDEKIVETLRITEVAV